MKTFLIDIAIRKGDKKFQKGKGTGLVIETLHRAKHPLSIKEINTRMIRTKGGRSLEVNVLGRIRKTVKHFVNTEPFIEEIEGKFSLIEA